MKHLFQLALVWIMLYTAPMRSMNTTQTNKTEEKGKLEKKECVTRETIAKYFIDHSKDEFRQLLDECNGSILREKDVIILLHHPYKPGKKEKAALLIQKTNCTNDTLLSALGKKYENTPYLEKTAALILNILKKQKFDFTQPKFVGMSLPKLFEHTHLDNIKDELNLEQKYLWKVESWRDQRNTVSMTIPEWAQATYGQWWQLFFPTREPIIQEQINHNLTLMVATLSTNNGNDIATSGMTCVIL